jgi:dihydropyrimidinase
MAYKGALMVNDDELYNSFARCAHLGVLPLVHAENGDVVARMQEALLERGITGPEGHAFFAAATGRRRSHQPRHHE